MFKEAAWDHRHLMKLVSSKAAICLLNAHFIFLSKLLHKFVHVSAQTLLYDMLYFFSVLQFNQFQFRRGAQ